MDAGTAALHAPEPGHLAFGELVDGDGESLTHLPVVELAQKIECDELVLKPVGNESFCRHSAVQQTLYLLHHSLF